MVGHLVADVGRHAPSVPSSPVDPTERFGVLMREPEERVPLADAALLIAAHDHGVDIDEQLAMLDDLGRDAPEDPERLARYLFVDCGFAGNDVDYGDPRNSYLDEVLRRRLGIPITLCVLMLEVGRRRGLSLTGVGMPGHFLVGDADGAFYDPFHGGARLDADGCRMLFAATQGAVPFLPQYLEPVGARTILARMLANLIQTFAGRDPATALWAVRLRLLIPGRSIAERREGAALLGRLGRFAEAAGALEALAGELDGGRAEQALRDAAGFRARAN
jgi:regulator of sirC expression with transglutaminase-like and TPR domain